MGGPKGSGLALAISLLVVLLAGADSDDELASLYKDFDRPQNAGHIFIAIEASRLADPEPRLDAIIERLVALRPVNGTTAVHYPGQEGARLARARRESGIPVNPADLLAIAETCGAFGLSDLQQRALAILPR
jgi:LDH2 family malate/lactate/ureidoglycolate dehydrogenase